MANPLNISVQFEGEDQGATALTQRIISLLKQMEQAQKAADDASRKFGAGAKETNQAMSEAARFARDYAEALQQRSQVARQASNEAQLALLKEKETQRQLVQEARNAGQAKVAAAKEVLAQTRQSTDAQLQGDQANLRQARQVLDNLRDQGRQQIDLAKAQAISNVESSTRVRDSRRSDAVATVRIEKDKLDQLKEFDRQQRAIERAQVEAAAARVRATQATAIRNPDSANAQFAVRLARENLTEQIALARQDRAARQDQIQTQRTALSQTRDLARQEIESANNRLNSIKNTNQGIVRSIIEQVRARVESAKQTVNAARDEVSVTRSLGQQQRAEAQAQVQSAQQVARAQVQAATQAGQATLAPLRLSAAQARQNAGLMAQQATAANQTASRLQRAAGAASQAINQFNQAAGAGAQFASALVRQLAELAVAFEAAKALRDFIAAGIKFNEVIQTSALGIATLVTAQSKLFDINGRLVTGQEALNRALSLAGDQLTKLRIAGIQTAATTQQLVDAYQQAVGAGLAAGLNLDQIRQLTVQVVQAAGALGVPMNQLNQEIRSILEGTIDRNSRVAKALRITNQEIRNAAKSGQLFETLFKRFEAFTVAGPKIAATFQAMKSNLAESVQTLAGLGSKGLFDTITELGNKAISQIFNFKTGQVTDQFQPLVKTLDDILSRIGQLAGSVLSGVIDGAKNFGAAWEANKERIDEVLDDLGDIVTQVIRIVVSVTRAGVALVKFLLDTRAIHFTLALIEGVLQFIADHIKAIGVILGGFALRAGIAALATVPALLALIAANPITAAVIGIVALGGAFNALANSAKEAARKQEEAEEATRRAQATNAGLAREYATVTKALEDKRLKTDQVKLLQERQKQLEEQLIKSGGEYADILGKQGKAHRDLAQDMDALTKKRIDEKVAALAQAQATLEAVKAEKNRPSIKTLSEKGDIQGLVQRKTGLPSLTEAQANLEKARKDLLGFNTAVVNGAQEANNLVTTVVSANRFAADSAKDALDRLKGLTEATIKNIKEQLETDTLNLQNKKAADLVSERDFLQQILVLNARAIAAQIEAKQKLLTATTDPGDQEKLKGDIQSLNKDLVQLALKNQGDIIKLNQDAAKTSRGLVVQEFRNAGNDLAAAAFDSGERYMDALKTAIDNGDEALRDRIQKLIQEDVTNAFRQKLQDEASRAQSELQNTLTRIQVLSTTGQIGSGAAFKLQRKAYEEAIVTLEQLAKKLQAVAVTDAQKQSVKDLITLIQQLKGELSAGEFTMRAFGEHVAQIFADELGPAIKHAFESIFDKTKKASDAFREMALAVVDAISTIITKLLAIKIVESIAGVKLQGVFAEGGYTGPGQKYEPAGVVHKGEYVLNAQATQDIGLARLDYANRFGRLPRFSDGGLVASALTQANTRSVQAPDPGVFTAGGAGKALQAQAAQVSLEGFLELGLDEGIVLKHMDANFVKLAKKHRKAMGRLSPERRV